MELVQLLWHGLAHSVVVGISFFWGLFCAGYMALVFDWDHILLYNRFSFLGIAHHISRGCDRRVLIGDTQSIDLD